MTLLFTLNMIIFGNLGVSTVPLTGIYMLVLLSMFYMVLGRNFQENLYSVPCGQHTRTCKRHELPA